MSGSENVLLQCPYKHSSGYYSQIVNTYQFLSEDPLKFVTEALLRPEGGYYSGTSIPFFPRGRCIALTEPSCIAAFLRNYRYGGEQAETEEFRTLKEAIGSFSPLTCQNTAEHTELRREWKESTFSPERVRAKHLEISRVAQEFMETFQGEIHKVSERMLVYTLHQSLSNIIKTSCEIDVEELAVTVKKIEQYIVSEVLWKRGSFSPFKREVFNDYEEVIEKIINEDSFGLINDLHKLKASDKVLKSAAKTAVLIGTGTTRSALVSTLYCLIKHPEEQELLAQALQEKFQGLSEEELLDADWESCKEFKDFLQEVLRLYTPIPFLPRRITSLNEEDSVIFEKAAIHLTEKPGDIFENTSVLLSAYHCHRRKEEWDDPEEFLPGRYRNDSRKGRLFTFSENSTRCLGERYAKAVIYTLLGPLLLKNRFVAPLDDKGNLVQKVTARLGMTLCFDQELQFRLVPR